MPAPDSSVISWNRPVPSLTKNALPMPGRCHEEIRIPVVIGVGERGRHAHASMQGHAGLLGEIFESAVAQIAPQFVSADLVYKIQVGQTVAVDIGNGQPRPVVVVIELGIAGGVGNHPIQKMNPARLQLVGEAEVVARADVVGGGELCRPLLVEPGSIKDVGRDGDVDDFYGIGARFRQDRAQIGDQPAIVVLIETFVNSPDLHLPIDNSEPGAVRNRRVRLVNRP